MNDTQEGDIMETKKSHRLSVTLSSDDVSHVMTHNEKMAIIWQFLNPNKYWHKEEQKPYVWNIEVHPGGLFTLMFASIHQKDVDHVETAISGLPHLHFNMPNYKSGYTILDVRRIDDADTDNSYIRLSSMNGCQCFCRKTNYENNRKKYLKFVSAKETPEEFAKSIRAGLLRRVKAFYGETVDENDVRISFVEETKPAERIRYKTGNILTQFVTFKLTAPRIVQEAALYGGIGKEPSSGFGFVV